MKWCFLVNSASLLPIFFGKLAKEIVKTGDDCLVILSSKYAEYDKKRFFPNEIKFISAIDWIVNNHREKEREFYGLSWKEFFPLFYRNRWGNVDYNKSIRITLQHIQFFKFILEKEKPDIIISESPSGLFHEVAYHFCKRNNTPYLGMESSKFDDRMDIYDTKYLTCSKYGKTFNQLSDNDISSEEKKYVQKFIKEFISHKTSVLADDIQLNKVHFSQFGIVIHYIKRLKDMSGILLKYLIKRKAFKDFDCESESVVKTALSAPFRMEKRQLKILLQKNVFSKLGAEDEKFFFYPLQLQPESSTSVCATYYYDQLNTVKNIAFALPFPYRLFVKEHPASVGLRSESFYNELKKLPNVVLIGPGESVQELIRRSDGVIVLTSTVGMEAALVGKPVYVFGKVYYSHHPFCRKVSSFEELKEKIEEDAENRNDVDLSGLENINNRFIVAHFRNTIQGTIPLAAIGEDTNNYKQILIDLKNFIKH